MVTSPDPDHLSNLAPRDNEEAIRDARADNIALVLQGRLAVGDVIAEAGLSAQPKVHPKAL